MPSTIPSLILMVTALSSVISQQPENCMQQLERCTKATDEATARMKHDPIQASIDINEGHALLTDNSNYEFHINATAQQTNKQDLAALLSKRQKECDEEFRACLKKNRDKSKREKLQKQNIKQPKTRHKHKASHR